MPIQIIKPANQKMLPLIEVLSDGRVPVGAVEEGYRGLQRPQRIVEDLEKMQLMKLLAMTSLPTPITGMKLRPQLTQQMIPQPGRAGGLATTLSHFLTIWLTNTFRKMKQPRRQQNSTSVYPTIRIMPTPQPRSMKWMAENRPLTLSSTFVPSQRTRAQMMRSKRGQAQMIKKTVLIDDRFWQQTQQREGSARAQMKYRPAMISRGKMVLLAASLVLLSPLLLITATIRVSTKQAAQYIQSLQKLFAKMVRTMSRPSRISSSPKKQTNLSTLLSCFSIR